MDRRSFIASDNAIRRVQQRNAEELRQIQDNHRSRKERIVENNEKDLRSTEVRYNEKKKRLTNENRAAISHIKKNHDNLKKNLENYQRDNITRLRQSYDEQRVSKETSQQQKLSNLENRLNSQRAKLRGAIQLENSKAQNANESLRQKARLYVEHQEFRKRLARESADIKLQQIQEKNSLEIQELRAKTQSEIARVRKDLNKQTNLTKAQKEKEMQDIEAKAEKRIKEMQKKHQDRETLAVKNHNQKITDLENSTTARLLKMKEQGDIELQKTQFEQNEKVLAQDKSYRKKEADMKQLHADELVKIHKQNDNLVHKEKTRLEGTRNQLNSQYSRMLKNDKDNFTVSQKKAEESYFDLIAKNDAIYRKNLELQTKEFEKQYEVNNSLNQQIAENQTRIFNRELLKERGKFEENISQYQDIAKDPFYSAPKFQTQFIEDNDKFTLKAQVPEHEMKNVEVRVQKDKITLSGKREFNEKIQNEEGNQSFQTNSFQAFRQDFDLDFPIYEKAVTQNYENGLLTVVVPKLGTMNKKS